MNTLDIPLGGTYHGSYLWVYNEFLSSIIPICLSVNITTEVGQVFYEELRD